MLIRNISVFFKQVTPYFRGMLNIIAFYKKIFNMIFLLYLIINLLSLNPVSDFLNEKAVKIYYTFLLLRFS